MCRSGQWADVDAEHRRPLCHGWRHPQLRGSGRLVRAGLPGRGHAGDVECEQARIERTELDFGGDEQ